MKESRITAHCVVKNEDRWIYYALNSILPYVEQVLVFDTGSTDKTSEIIKLIKSPKIIFEEKGSVDRERFVKLRQEQIDRTKTEWFLILDGDEIWPKSQIEKLIKEVRLASDSSIALFNRTRNCIGDIYHYLPDSSGNYEIAGIRGNLNIRLIRKTPDLKVMGVYPDEYYGDKNGPVQKQEDNLLFVNCWYLHTTFLERSSLGNKTSGSLGKQKTWEKGIFMKGNELPEVLKMERPGMVADPYKSRGLKYELLALAVKPLKTLKKWFRK